MSFWNNVRALRVKQQISQREMAEKVSAITGTRYEQGKYCWYETGNSKRTPDELKQAISVVLGTHIEELDMPDSKAIERFPVEVQKWIADAEKSDRYIIQAYAQYLQDIMRKPSQ